MFLGESVFEVVPAVLRFGGQVGGLERRVSCGYRRRCSWKRPRRRNVPIFTTVALLAALASTSAMITRWKISRGIPRLLLRKDLQATPSTTFSPRGHHMSSELPEKDSFCNILIALAKETHKQQPQDNEKRSG